MSAEHSSRSRIGIAHLDGDEIYLPGCRQRLDVLAASYPAATLRFILPGGAA